MTENAVYKYLIKTFGGVQYSGVRYLARLVCTLGEKDLLTEHYMKQEEENNSTPAAVERAVRYYLNFILTQVSLEDLSVMYDYPFSPTTTRLSNRKFIRILQNALEGNL